MTKQHAIATIATDEHGQKAIRETEGGTRITMVASTASRDRDGDKIRVAGWRWNDAALPKLLWAHDYRSADSVIGRLVRVWVDGERLMIEAEMADKVAGHDTAKLVAGLLRDGFLDQGSVGFIPEEWLDGEGNVRTPESPGRLYGPVEYVKQELLEFSICPVPSQRDSVLVGLRALGLADSAPVVPARPDVASTPRETVGEGTPDPESKAVQIVQNALPDPGDPDWFTDFIGAVRAGSGAPPSGVPNDGKGWAPDFLSHETRVDTAAQ